MNAATYVSTGPARYILDGSRNVHPEQRMIADVGVMSTNAVSHNAGKGLVDVESNLMNLQLPASRCPGAQFQPASSKPAMDDLKVATFATDATRISNPILCTGRGLAANRFQPLCLNPQDEQRWLQQAEVGINYRMVVKDNHVPNIPTPVCQKAALPTGAPATRRSSTTVQQP